MNGKNTAFLALIAVFCLATLLSVSPVFAQHAVPLPSDECNITILGAGGCGVAPNGASIADGSGGNSTGVNGVRSDSGPAAGAIDVWNLCRYVNNTSPAGNPVSLFVPLKSSTEWHDFNNNAPSTNPVSLMHCSKPAAGLTTVASPACPSPSVPTPATVSEPKYALCNPGPGGTCLAIAPSWAAPRQDFTCNPGGLGAPWTEHADATYTGLDSDLMSPSWTTSQAQTVYSATPSACGSANGAAAASAPASGLCNAGVFSGFTGASPWTWNCSTGQPPLATVACATAAAAAPVNGVCGADNGSTLSSTPTALCNAGSPTGVSGGGPWSWSCLGSGGGTNAGCSANYASVVNGACGADDGATLSAPPSSVCSAGSFSGLSGGGPWSWSCFGSGGGSNASCGANYSPPPPPPINGICGPDNGATLNSGPSALCNAGTPTGVSGSGPWSWGCLGANGGSNDSCSANVAAAPPIDGACGPNGYQGPGIWCSPWCAAGNIFLGGMTTVQHGMWWSCDWPYVCYGINGGANVFCDDSGDSQ